MAEITADCHSAHDFIDLAFAQLSSSACSPFGGFQGRSPNDKSPSDRNNRHPVCSFLSTYQQSWAAIKSFSALQPSLPSNAHLSKELFDPSTHYVEGAVSHLCCVENFSGLLELKTKAGSKPQFSVQSADHTHIFGHILTHFLQTDSQLFSTSISVRRCDKRLLNRVGGDQTGLMSFQSRKLCPLKCL